MKRDQTVKWLQLIGVKVYTGSGRTGWVISNCPLEPWKHEGGKSNPEVFGVKTTAGDAFCNCFACGFHGKQSQLLIEMKQLNKMSPKVSIPFGEALQQVIDAEEATELNLDSPGIEELLFAKKEKLHAFSEDWLSTFPKWDAVKFAVEYLADRDVTPAVAAFLQLHADTTQRRVCFPVRDFSGVLRGLHGRQIEDIEPRYRMYLTDKGQKNTAVWLGENWVDLDKPVIFVEGPFDLASTLRVYKNTVCPLYSNPNVDKLKRMAGASEIITYLDRGAGGDAGRKKIQQYYKGSIVHHILPPEGLVDKYGKPVKDPGQMSMEQHLPVLEPLVTPDFSLA